MKFCKKIDLQLDQNYDKQGYNTSLMGGILLVDLIGFWTRGVITYAHTEDEGIYFDPDGTGFISWSNLFVETFDTFTWSMNDGHLFLSGCQKYVMYHGKTAEMRPTDIGDCSTLVKRIKSKSLDEDDIDTLIFPKSCNLLSEKRLGFVCENIWGIKCYSELEEMLKERKLTGQIL